mgnify:CR=1 FL=1
MLELPFLADLLQMPADLFQVFVTMDEVTTRFGTLAAGLHIIALAPIGSFAVIGRLRIGPKRLARRDGSTAFARIEDSVAVLDDVAQGRLLEQLLPQAEHVLFSDNAELNTLLAA